MKQTLLTRLVLGAIAGIAVAGTAQAGQITASSTNIAREVIYDNTQTIVSPTISYRFAGDINATVQVQEFQVQFALESGAAWGPAPSADAFTITPTVGTNAGLAGQGGTNFTVSNIGVDTATNTLWATIRVPVAPVAPWTTSLLDQPIITVNGITALPITTKATIKGLKTVVGDLVTDYTTAGKCADNKSLFVNFKHFKLLANPAALAVDGTNGVADEHARSGATNRAGIVNFPTNLLVSFAASNGDAKVDPAGLNKVFKGTTTAGTLPSFVSTTLANLGKLTLVQNATGYDANLVNQYLLAGAGAGLQDDTTADQANGIVEVNNVKIDVTASQGFAPGSSLFLSTTADCTTGPIAGSTVATGATNTTTVTVPNTTVAASFGATGVGPVYVCYNVAAATGAIPLSAFTAVGTIVKASQVAVGDGFAEQNNVCNGNLYTLGGGIKIDVRNYANSKDPAGWQSVIRLINNNESRTVDVWAQLIQVDGKYGPYGKIATLAPREAKNMSSPQIDALLINAPASTANGDSTPQATGTGARLRIVSEQASSLRVQNYLVNPKTGAVMEFSSSQGVDFEGNDTRVPVSGGAYVDQTIDQDAQASLNGK